MKLGERLGRLQLYCAEIAEYYPIRCEVTVEPGEREGDSDWVIVTAHDLSTTNGNKRTSSSPHSPAVNCCEAWLDDLMVEWFGKKEL
jgi:hypothetical protein